MAEDESMELPILLNRGEPDHVTTRREPMVLEDLRVRRELYADRYRLEAPTFTGEEEVEQFSKNSKRCWRLHDGRQEWRYSS